MLYHLPVNDEGVYELTCRRGHQSVFFSQEHKFEVLFEIAVVAVVDGYYREAVASATAGLERFYEYCTRLLLKVHDVPHAEVEKAWKEVQAQSERQLGLFLAAHLLHFGKSPAVLKTDTKKGPCVYFRNAVIHKGKIPTKPEAIEYLEEIAGLIVPLINQLKETVPEALKESISINTKVKRANYPDVNPVTLSSGTTISLATFGNTANAQQPVAKRIAEIEAARARQAANVARGGTMTDPI